MYICINRGCEYNYTVKTTRQLIYEHIQNKLVATSVEISHALGVSPANVRHHLSILLAEGAIAIIGKRPPQGRGRPTLLYSAAKQAHQHNLDQLSSVLLRELLENKNSSEQQSHLREIGYRMAGERRDKQTSLTQRLYHAIQRFNEMKYQARWEARSTAPQIILGYCPYAAILSEHPELCKLDKYLLEEILEVPVQHTARLVRDKLGLTFCMFTVSQ